MRKLAGQTVYYGLSSIVGRFVTFILTPIYTYSSIIEESQYGQMTELMIYIALVMMFFTMRFEVAYFRFSIDKERQDIVYSTSFLAVFANSLLLGMLIIAFATPIARFLHYDGMAVYFRLIGLILMVDGMCEIPFSKLRYEGKAKLFALIKLANIALFVSLNIWLVLICPIWAKKGFLGTDLWYQPSHIIAYILTANVIASLFSLFLLKGQWRGISMKIDSNILKSMFVYALPLIVVGFAGTITDRFNIAIMKWLLPGTMEQNEIQLGIYAANFRLTILIMLFTQAFRYAAEPFFFAESSSKNAPRTYANVTKYYAIFCLYGYLFVTLFIDIIKYFIGPNYWSGLGIVPILLLANLFAGLFYNVSIWYRLKDKTLYGAIIAIIGAIITIVLNYVLVPQFGYMGSAYSSLLTYIFITLLCYIWGQKIFPVPYQIRLLTLWIVIAIALQYLFFVIRSWTNENLFIDIPVAILFMVIFSCSVLFFEQKMFNTLKDSLKRRFKS